MKTSFTSRVFGAAGTAVLTVAAAVSAAGDAESLAGDWSGTSICVENHDSCRDEKALYHLTGPDDRRRVSVIGSKIVDGREIVMGPPLEFAFDAEKHTLVCEAKSGLVFRFTVTGATMDGTLTLASGVVYRRISLKKDPKPA